MALASKYFEASLSNDLILFEYSELGELLANWVILPKLAVRQFVLDLEFGLNLWWERQHFKIQS